MDKPEQVYEDDPIPSADIILYEMSHDKKDPMIKNFMNMIEPFSIENNDCDKCCEVKKLKDSSINDEEFFQFYKWNNKLKLDDDDEEEDDTKIRKVKNIYKAPENVTYMFRHKEKKPKKSKLSKLKNK